MQSRLPQQKPTGGSDSVSVQMKTEGSLSEMIPAC